MCGKFIKTLSYQFLLRSSESMDFRFSPIAALALETNGFHFLNKRGSTPRHLKQKFVLFVRRTILVARELVKYFPVKRVKRAIREIVRDTALRNVSTCRPTRAMRSTKPLRCVKLIRCEIP